MVRGVSSGPRVLPGSTAAGEASRVSAGGGDGNGGGRPSGGVGEHFTPQGKFGLGVACKGESSFWRQRPRQQPGPAKGMGDDGGGEGEAACAAGPAQSQGGLAGLLPMEVCPPQPQPATAAAASMMPQGPSGGASGVGGGGAVFSPRSPNKKSLEGMARGPASCPRVKGSSVVEASSADARGAGAASSPAACRADQNENENENRGPGATPRVSGAAELFPELVDRSDSSDAGGVADGLAGGPRTARGGGPLDNLPRGWSSASRPGVMGNGRRRRRRQQERQEEEGEEEGTEGLGPKQQQKKMARKGGSSRGSPLPRNNHTLMAIWSRGQGAPSSEAHGKGVPEDVGP